MQTWLIGGEREKDSRISTKSFLAATADAA